MNPVQQRSPSTPEELLEESLLIDGKLLNKLGTENTYVCDAQVTPLPGHMGTFVLCGFKCTGRDRDTVPSRFSTLLQPIFVLFLSDKQFRKRLSTRYGKARTE
jgi:hypothetical protein